MKKAKQNKGQEKKKAGKKTGRNDMPIAYSSVSSARVPRVTAINNGCVVTHREMIGSINGSIAYTTAMSLAIQPGVDYSFPWLYRMANNYESYKFRKLRYVYEPVCPTTTAGLLVIGADFDAGDSAPTTEVDLAAKAGSVSGPVYQRFTMDCPTARMRALGGIFFTRYQPVGVGRAVQTYDAGNVYVGVGGCAHTNRIGTIYVEYTVELITPGPPAVYDGANDSAQFLAGGPTINPAAPFAAAEIMQASDLPIQQVTNNTITFREPGDYLLQLIATGTGFTGLAPDLDTINCQAVRGTNIVNGTATSLRENIFVSVLQPAAQLIATFGGVATSLGAMRVLLSPFKSTLNPYL